MKERTSPRKPIVLTEAIQRRLVMYALSATTAGVGTLALVQAAEAKIVYQHVHVILGGYSLNPAGEAVAPFYAAAAFSSFTTTFYWARLSFNPQTAGAKFVRGGASSWSVAALPEGAVIGPKAKWGGSRGLAATYGRYGGGTFKHHKGGFQFGHPAFVGFKFQISGEPRYGWARLTVRIEKGYRGQKHVYGILSGYAYETAANKAIIAGKTKGTDVITRPMDTGTLGHLARGRE